MPIMFNRVGLAMQIPGLLDKTIFLFLPFRWGTNLIHSAGPWSARLGFDWYAAQNRVPLGSVPTDSYTLWHAFVNYKQKVSDTTLNWFAKVDKLFVFIAFLLFAFFDK